MIDPEIASETRWSLFKTARAVVGIISTAALPLEAVFVASDARISSTAVLVTLGVTALGAFQGIGYALEAVNLGSDENNNFIDTVQE